MRKKLQTIIASALVVVAAAVPVFADVTGVMTTTTEEVTETTTIVEVKLGDVNGDDEIDSKDALAVLKYDVGLAQDDFNEAAADVNKDTVIDSKDALEILKYDVGLILIGD